MIFKIILFIVFAHVTAKITSELSCNERHLLSVIEELKRELKRDVKRIEEKLENLTNVSYCESDWFSYSDKKCFKVLGIKGTENEAKDKCNELDNSTLITISYEDEQEYLNSYLKSYRIVSPFVWIGLENVSSSFQWMDGTDLKYENWGENAIKDGTNKCVQMSLLENHLGNWTDDNCNRKYLVVCQKKQSSKSVLSDDVSNLTKVIEKMQSDMNTLKAETVPIGFIYAQLPNEKSPSEIWPHLKWQDISSLYGGVFFRVEGERSAKFGDFQDENMPRIDKFITDYRYNSTLSPTRCNDYKCNTDIPISGYSGWTWTGASDGTNMYATFHSSGGEVRPRNMAIRIWKRVKFEMGNFWLPWSTILD